MTTLTVRELLDAVAGIDSEAFTNIENIEIKRGKFHVVQALVDDEEKQRLRENLDDALRECQQLECQSEELDGRVRDLKEEVAALEGRISEIKTGK